MSETEIITPKVLISKCLGFAGCRFDGTMFQEKFIEELKDFVKFVPVCPEEELGLGTPRKVLRLYDAGSEKDMRDLRLYQQETDIDLTEEMENFSTEYLSTLTNIQGAILKTRSPSCAIKDAKIYADKDSNITARRGGGLFGEKFMESYPHLPTEHEGRLKNRNIRENFLTKIFTLARFEKVRAENDIKELMNFHAQHKFLFMSYNEEQKKVLGQLIASQKSFSSDELFDQYHLELCKLLQGENHTGRRVNVLMHIMGFFKDKVSQEEKAFLLDTIDKYRDNQMPLSVPINILKSWAIKYQDDYLLEQYFFTPFPEELMDLSDSGKNSNT